MAAAAASALVALSACGGGGAGSGPGNPVIESPSGVVSQSIQVVDGDTIDIDGQRYRLAGFDAPERYQSCRDATERVWACGQAATEELERLVSVGGVSCSESGMDRYGRIVGSCSAGGEDVGAALVRAGLAIDDPRYNPSYAADEEEARRELRGMHSGRYLPPWDWRRGERLGDASPSLLLTDGVNIDAEDLLPSIDHAGVIGPTSTDGNPSAAVYGAWMGRSAFAVRTGDGLPMGISWAPHFPATDPKELDGGARWSGLVVGADTLNGHIVTGQTAIELRNFSHPAVDVEFTGIKIIETGVALGDMRWKQLPVLNGAFASDDQGGSRIEGRFYGDRHQEAGGVFEHPSIIGAFGVTRE